MRYRHGYWFYRGRRFKHLRKALEYALERYHAGK